MVRALAQGFALEFEPIRVVDQPVQDGVSDSGVGDEFMPLVYRELAGDQGCPLAVIDDLQEVPEGFFGSGNGPEIIDDQQAGSGQPFQEGRQAAVGMGRAQGSEQFGAVEEDRAMPIPAGLMAQCARQVGFADAGWSGDQAVALLLDPSAGAQLVDVGPFQAAAGAIVDALGSGVSDLELGVFEACGHASVFAPHPLAFHQQSQAILEVQPGDVLLVTLFLQCLCHAFQVQDAELFDGLGVEHRSGVVGAAAEVFMDGASHGWFVFQGLALEPALQDGFDACVGAGAEMQGSHAGGLDPLGAEGFTQPHDAQT